jgi:N-acetylmuramoyl-L-alanine amidase
VGILFDLKQTDVIQQSSLLAESVLTQIEDGGTRRGQAGAVAVPAAGGASILVECVINNQVEERLLRDPQFQRDMARIIARGATTFLAKAPPVVRGRTSVN